MCFPALSTLIVKH